MEEREKTERRKARGRGSVDADDVVKHARMGADC